MKFIQITDSHLIEPGARLYGLDPLARLQACVADVNARHADAAFCIVTGDITHRGTPEAFRAFGDAIGALRMPWRLMLGNHDDRDNFRQAFPGQVVDENGFVQSVFDRDGFRCILLDSHDKGFPHGRLCEARRGWLAARLAEAGHMPILLFLHHPPMPVGIKRMDQSALQEPEKFAALLAPYDNIRHMFFGHLHRPLAGSWRGIPFSCVRGPSHQVALDLEIVDKVPGSLEPAGYSVVLVDQDSTVVHFHDFMDQTATFTL
ncbi:MAG: phosphodiesterase [Alphaproteobacteria bacterium]|nr:phosphodiesterase [Alphaproteobacteria bacterium]